MGRRRIGIGSEERQSQSAFGDVQEKAGCYHRSQPLAQGSGQTGTERGKEENFHPPTPAPFCLFDFWYTGIFEPGGWSRANQRGEDRRVSLAVASKVVVRSGDRGRYWPGGGRGGSPLEGIASPGVGRTRLEESQRIGRPARITRATPSAVVAARSWWA